MIARRAGSVSPCAGPIPMRCGIIIDGVDATTGNIKNSSLASLKEQLCHASALAKW
jgi:hypothetical protein